MLFIEHGFIKALDKHTLVIGENGVTQGDVAELVFVTNKAPRVFSGGKFAFCTNLSNTQLLREA